jgi:heptaprenyl diphosphate synthase
MVLIGLFVAIATVLHIVESWIPIPIPVPGAKLGLANIVSLVAIAIYGYRWALLVAILRVFLGTLLGGMFLGPSFLMGLSGALVSTVVMAVGYHYWRPPFSINGISVIGAVVHNLTQICVAALLVASAGLLWYLPYLMLLALPTGIATGLTAVYFLEKLPPQIR